MTDKKYVKFQDLSELISIADVEREARKQWDIQQRRRRRVEHWLMRLLPIGLLVMAFVFYALSAPHTAYIVNLITPGWGWVAPVGFELGIVIISALRAAKWRNLWTLFLLLGLVGMSVVINIAGGFMAVVDYGTAANLTEVAGLTLVELAMQYGGLPAVFQVAIFLVAPFGLAIPLIAAIVGEIIVRIALGHIRLERESDDSLWLREMPSAVYRALLQAALKAGAGTTTAAKWARAYTESLADISDLSPEIKPQSGNRSIQPVRTPAPLPQPPMGFTAIPGQKITVPQTVHSPISPVEDVFVPEMGQIDSTQNNKQDGLPANSPRVKIGHVRSWLADRDDWQHLGDREVARMYMRDVFGVDSDSAYKTIQRARKELQ